MHFKALVFQAQYFDGMTSTPHAVEVSLVGEKLALKSDLVNKQIATQSLEFLPPVGSAKAVIMLQEDGELHVSDLFSFDALSKILKPSAVEHITRFFETRLAYTLAALVFCGVFIFAGLLHGLPALASYVTEYLPANTEQMIGMQSLQAMDQWLMSPSKLSEDRQQAITRRLQDICNQQRCPHYQLHFRASKMGANAFALPAGDIVVTDDLVTLAQQDEKILAVLFHELGHVQRRHSIRLAVQSAGAAVFLVAVTGDLSSLSDLAAGLPMLLMQSGCQRDMEREADDHALTMLKVSGIAPQHFANIMIRITDKSEQSEHNKHGSISLLNSHPDTASRIQAFQK